jgi:hypothetical protein
MKRSMMTAVAALGLAVAVGSPRARGGPLDPNAFTPLGTLSISSGSYTFNTTTDQLLDSSNNVLFTGVTFNGIAVFDFSGITIGGGTFTGTGSRPLALLSQGNISFTGGRIDVSGGRGSVPPVFIPGSGGPGGFGGGAGPGAGSPGRNIPGSASTAGGGGFGGPGGPGMPGVPGDGSGGPGGPPYGDLATQLVGGSGGGRGNTTPLTVGYSGGGGGGAIELGATGSLAINGGTIAAAGGPGGGSGSGGGGSGGGIFLHADSVGLAGSGVLDVGGGFGSGGGGGGRILILANSYNNSGTFDLAGGSGNVVGSNGGPGVLTTGALPEPSSLLLLATALPIVAYTLRRRSSARSRAA